MFPSPMLAYESNLALESLYMVLHLDEAILEAMGRHAS
jgi:hypothetical protein